MPQEIRLWEIGAGNQLCACTPSSLDLESRLEDWLERDISILAPDLLIIGRQVGTAFDGIIDLLCIDRAGNLVVVELKRDKTPREITAQCLDYASWVQDLSRDAIGQIAEAYLNNTRLEDAFRQKFEDELPEAINENHRILVVASQVDPSSERIIKYLNSTYGVDINAVTFHYFKTQSGGELLGGVFLIEPSDVEYQTLTKRGSKRLPNLTYEDLDALAERNGVGDLYRRVVGGVESYFQKQTTRSSLGFTGTLEDSRRKLFNLIPGESNAGGGLRFEVYAERLKRLLGFSDEEMRSLLPDNLEPWQFGGNTGPDYSGFQGFFRRCDEIDRFVKGLAARIATK